MKDIVKKWNRLDAFFYRLDDLMERIKECFSKEEPDIEFIIEAETNYLKEENKLLKKLQFPKAMEKLEDTYVCPNKKCHAAISDTLMEKYNIKHCPECGQRIFINEYRKTGF